MYLASLSVSNACSMSVAVLPEKRAPQSQSLLASFEQRLGLKTHRQNSDTKVDTKKSFSGPIE